MIKNLDTLNADEMREMLKNIEKILDSVYYSEDINEQAKIQIDLIGMQFFADGMNEKDFNGFDELKEIVSQAKTHYILNLVEKNIDQWGQVLSEEQVIDLRAAIKSKHSSITGSY